MVNAGLKWPGHENEALASRNISLTRRAASPSGETFEALGTVFQDLATEILGAA